LIDNVEAGDHQHASKQAVQETRHTLTRQDCFKLETEYHSRGAEHGDNQQPGEGLAISPVI